MTSKDYSRRHFVGLGVAAAGATLVGAPLPLNAQSLLRAPRGAASNRVRFGIIGVGMQGQSLLGESIRMPDVECVAACDVYD